ncbi:hypothetical protein N656DRAFT_802678 [Canariomyces notabilis]|uniref:Cell wall protein n=1 Tax=Canariomyces notabilis TaxID=2074819 RepID=A0AAN6QCA5_9PEZI|nr:hypothetical protein N656DRAFT_802678 [Canariomyces arenarius]
MRLFKASLIYSVLLWSGSSIGRPLQLLASPCDELEAIMTDYGTLEGTLQGAMILLRWDTTQAGRVARQLLTLLDEATLNIQALYGSIPTCSPAETLNPRQNTEICEALSKVSADVAQLATLMDEFAASPDLPRNLYIEALQEAADDAEVKILGVQAALKASDGCT